MQTEKKHILNRLKRAEGQLRGVQKMLEDDQECFDIITQLTAIRSSINATMGLVIANKITDVVTNPESDPQKQEEKINEAIKLIIKK
ncbi:TPA: metal-sensitive transcriptional regulator [Streptococcus suis]